MPRPQHRRKVTPVSSLGPRVPTSPGPPGGTSSANRREADHNARMAPRKRAPEPPAPRRWVGRAYPLGATYDGSGTNFSLFSSVAEGVELCLLGPNGDHTEIKVALTEVDGHCWHAYLP